MKLIKLIKCLFPFIFVQLHALIFYSSPDPDYNINPTSQYLEIWNLQGEFGNFTGTVISPYHFITVKHFEPQKNIFVNGIAYKVQASYDDWGSDLRICKITGKFPNHASLYEKNDEIGKNVVIFGRGVGRGSEVRLNNELKGWRWNNMGGQMKWGKNIVDIISISYGGDTLKMLFDPQKNLQDLCSLSIGDSGGGVFIQDEGVWKLAGVNYAVDSTYGFNNLIGDEDEVFQGAIFDEQNLYKFDGQGWYGMKEHTSSGSYSIRVSSRVPWIKRIIEWTYPVSEIILQSSNNPNGPFRDEVSSKNDLDNQEISMNIPQESKYIRLSASKKLKITKIIIKQDKLVVFYGGI